MDSLRKLVEIQGTDGNWNVSEYMVGMYNGMELMLATLENRSPAYRSIDDVKKVDIQDQPLTDVNGHGE